MHDWHDPRDTFNSFHFDDDFDYFKHRSWWQRNGMSLWTWVGVGLVGAVVVVVLVRCCCRRNSTGRVLAPPPHNTSVPGPAPYPQQQFAQHYPAPVAVQVMTPGYPAAPAAYPQAVPAPYPTAGGYYPTEGHYPPDPNYPVGGYPMPHPVAATAPDAHAGPPSYSQVMGKQPPFNPSVPQ